MLLVRFAPAELIDLERGREVEATSMEDAIKKIRKVYPRAARYATWTSRGNKSESVEDSYSTPDWKGAILWVYGSGRDLETPGSKPVAAIVCLDENPPEANARMYTDDGQIKWPEHPDS